MIFRQKEIIPEVDATEVYVNNFDDLTGLTVLDPASNVSVSAPVGSLPPNVSSALTIDYATLGNSYAAVDLGTTYPKLYIQYYTCIVNQSTATSVTDNLKVSGNNFDEGGLVTEIRSNQSTTFSRFYGLPDNIFLSRRCGVGTWYKIGLVIDRTLQTVDYYIDSKFVDSGATNNFDLRYITMGGTGDNALDYKVQYASLTVNTDHFQDVIYNANGVGEYKTFFVDADIVNHPDYTIDWTGLHSEPYSIDGGVTFIDGPLPTIEPVGSGAKLGFTLVYDKFLFKNGQEHKMIDLATAQKVSRIGTFSSELNQTLGSYGSGAQAKVYISTEVDSGSWIAWDAPNFTYRVALTGITNCTGAFVDEVIGLRKATNLVQLETTSGAWWKDSTYLYVRLWDDSNPATHVIDASSNQGLNIDEYGTIENLTFLHGKAFTPPNGFLQNCKFSYGSGSDFNTFGTFRNNVATKIWGGQDYGISETSNPGFGLGASGDGVYRAYADSKIYNNRFEDTYSGITIFSDSDNTIFAYNEIKNTIVNSLNLVGSTTIGDPLKPVILGNNTLLHSPRNVDNDPYPLSRPQPGHSFVHQLGNGANFKSFNNLHLLHYVEGVLGVNSVMNLVSMINAGAIGELGYNRYYMTPTSTSPSTYFNQGDDTIIGWGTALASYGDFKDLDGIANPDSTSVIDIDLPIEDAVYTDTSGKWLSTDSEPITKGDGYTGFDYLSKGIYVDLAGNRIIAVKNIGAK